MRGQDLAGMGLIVLVILIGVGLWGLRVDDCDRVLRTRIEMRKLADRIDIHRDAMPWGWQVDLDEVLAGDPVPKDGWGRPIHLDARAKSTYELISFGADGRPGDDPSNPFNADIYWGDPLDWSDVCPGM